MTCATIYLDEDTFRDQAALHPKLEATRQTRQMLGQLKRPGLEVGVDGCNRTMLSAFRTVTGRNAPSTTKFIFGCPAWMRGLIRPEPDMALAYVDWEQQEFGIAAALSGDGAMHQAYQSEDCYLAFAKLHPDRRVCEAIQLVFIKFRELWSVRSDISMVP